MQKWNKENETRFCYFYLTKYVIGQYRDKNREFIGIFSSSVVGVFSSFF